MEEGLSAKLAEAIAERDRLARALEASEAARREVEEAARAREAVRVLVAVSVSDVIFHLGVEGDRFRFLEINPAFTKATGLEPAMVVGQLVDEVIPEPSLGVVLAKYREAIRERRTVRWIERTEYPTGTKYGEVSVTPVLDASGRCTRLVGTVHDVTDATRARELSAAMQRILESVASGSSLGETLSGLAAATQEQVPGSMASVLLVSADGKRLAVAAAPDLPEEWRLAIDGLRVGSAGGPCCAAIVERRPVMVDECWSVPILAGESRVLGSFALHFRQPRSASPAETELLSRAAHVAGIAVQRHEVDAQLRALSARIEAAREEERTGIAREIHDQLGQSLTAIKLDLAWIARRAESADGLPRDVLLAKVRDLSQLTGETIDLVRRISTELRPGVLDDLGLVAALTWQAQEFEKITNIRCTVRAEVGDEAPGRDIATAVFRVLQEALTNVVRHAHATRVDVALEERDAWLEMRVRDDGRGIAVAEAKDPRSLGLLGMRERARRLGGTASFERADPAGTLVTLRLPLAPVSSVGAPAAPA